MGEPFRLQEDHRALYHAAAVFASNYLVTATAVAEQLLAAAGVTDPARRDPARCSAPRSRTSRPWARPTRSPAPPCAATPARSSATSKRSRTRTPWAVAAYVEMARLALDLAVRSGRLAEDQRASVEEVLARWS